VAAVTTASRPRRTALALLAALTVLVPVSASVSATAPPETEPPAEAPAEPAATAPPATEAPGEPAEDDGSDIPWGTILLIGALVITLLVIVSALSARKSSRDRQAATPRRADPARSSLLSTSQWVHDQLTLELMAASPASARQRWATERSRLDNVAIGAQQQWTEGHGEAWQRLGQTTSALAGALETNISLREQPDPNPQLVQQSVEVVNRNRAVLQQLISALWPSVHS
jgi:hypothetical protein